jgi:hypothetical protein
MTEREKLLTGLLSDAIMNIEEVNRYCNEQAHARSGTKSSDFEQIENTPRYDLYWETYHRVQARLVLLAVTTWTYASSNGKQA